MKRFLIVGAGLSGICVAERLLHKGVAVTMIDHIAQPSSTAVAPGMYNPIVFKRLNKSWMADELVKELRVFYRGLESKLGITLLKDVNLQRRIPSGDYAQLWNQRLTDPTFSTFLGPINEGFAPVYNLGMLDCRLLVKHYTAYLFSEHIMKDETFEFAQLKLNGGDIQYQSETYDGVIFCEGPYVEQNPFFEWLPFKLCKGEWIIVETDREIEDKVVNDVITIIPLENKHYLLASTYEWDDLSWVPTTKAADQLMDAFLKIYDCSAKIVDHQAGVRPSAADRRPFLGTHPHHRNLHVFNGLGTKGVMLAPYFSQHFVDHILNNTPLLEEVDINRYIKRFYQEAT